MIYIYIYILINMTYEIIGKQIKKTLKYFNINNNLIQLLKEPNKIINVKVPVVLNNKYKFFSGYRVQHNNLLGPYKGGIRFNPRVDLDECKALAGWMTYNTALHNLPLGGGKGGLEINPHDFTNNELELISRNFITQLKDNIGEDKDIPAPDVGTNSIIMDHMNDELIKLTGKNNNFTGKSINNRGSQGREEATGYGIVENLKQWSIKNSIDMKGKTYILQGFGNVGACTAKYLDKLDMKLIAVGDHSCYIKNNDGIDVIKLIEYTKTTKQIKGFSDTEIDISEFWKIKCDVIIPAALELQINADIANNLQCKLILEGSNGPLYYEADDILESKGIDVIPDILANSGGVYVSYLEYLQNKDNKYLSEEDVLYKLSKQIELIFNDVYDLTLEKNTTYRNCCYGLALSNLEKKFI